MGDSEGGSAVDSKPSSTPFSAKLVALALGVGIAGVIAWFQLSRQTDRPVVELVRSNPDLERLHAERPKFAKAWNPSEAPPGHRHLPRFPVPEWVARQFFTIDIREQPWDELTYLRHIPLRDDPVQFPEHPKKSWHMRTNSLGLREDGEPRSTQPDLRILVTGDSHTDGVCENDESFPHVLQAELAAKHPDKVIEALNAGKGTFSFYNYLGTIEKFLFLRPDVFVVAVYGGNDFEEVLAPYHYFEGTERKPGAQNYWGVIEKALAVDQGWLAQDGLSLKFFQQYPDEIAVALRAAQQAAMDIQELCEAHSIRPVFVYIPGMIDTYSRSGAEDPKLEGLGARLHAAIELSAEDAGVHNRMADELLAFLAGRGIATLDLREVFAGRKERLFWLLDHHINVAAHRAIGEALVPVIEALFPEGLR